MGTSLMAELLRTTIGALNNSFDTEVETSNRGKALPGMGRPGLPQGGLTRVLVFPACLPRPTGMTGQQYLNTCLPLAALAALCLAQVYPFRLRRAIAAFYFPKVSGPRVCHSPGVASGLGFGWAASSRALLAQREKARVLFLYNKLLRQRKNFLHLQRGRIARKARQPPGLVSGDRDTGWVLPLSPPRACGLTRAFPGCRERRCCTGAAGGGRGCSAASPGAAPCAGRPREPSSGPAPLPTAMLCTASPAGEKRVTPAWPAALPTPTSPRIAARRRRSRDTRDEGVRE